VYILCKTSNARGPNATIMSTVDAPTQSCATSVITAGAQLTGGGVSGCNQSQNPPKLKFKEAHFVGTIISKFLRDLLFSKNQPLKWPMTTTLYF